MITNPKDFFEQFQNFIEEVVNRLIKRKGNNGTVSNYETVSFSSVINADAPNAIEANADINVENGEIGTAWRKVVRANADISVSLGDGWKWSNDEKPTIKNGYFLIFIWCGRSGIASILK